MPVCTEPYGPWAQTERLWKWCELHTPRGGLEVPRHSRGLQSHVLAARCTAQVWSQSGVEVRCGPRVGEHPVRDGKSDNHVGNVTSAGSCARAL